MTGLNCNLRNLLRHGVMAVGAIAALALLVIPASTPAASSQRQMQFASPEEAVEALVKAARDGETGGLLNVLGPAGNKLVYSGDPVADKLGREKFVTKYDAAHKIERQNDTTAILSIGDEAWPFAIPIVKEGGAWRFDTAKGAQEILTRRIGRNELNAIEVCRAYVDAQREYASVDRNGDGILEYAQKFRSSPGRHDGLYWDVQGGEEESPMGPMVASARAEGYGGKEPHRQRAPYHGYYYKILIRQGAAAMAGAFDYVVNGHMIGGFALVAFPAKYGGSGIMTFIVNQDGTVYQKNLGPDTAAIARQMTIFNPDLTWTTVRH
ncbi:MAG TPA: DUF2950 domain-containing protein [Gammaproteobacteria bacterium]|nr:DUF2950 domain-containing protein [Gammaproteobacteria bacterium]